MSDVPGPSKGFSTDNSSISVVKKRRKINQDVVWTKVIAQVRKLLIHSVMMKISQTRAKASATADGLAPEGASQTKKFCLQVIKKRPRKKFCLQVIKKRPRKPDVADVHEWCSAATVSKC
ncbi:hypothetical protein EVAR_77791_1 [Eumeta japonica]|uniref:Uncharacterized protein n=1 Tax=Eumeta variegata TaxID=151549 RepID=A0A4C1TDM0_EUMVA|nr:hypothetical protein EVAR_77791_1 [Eumeta japonica]